MTRFLPTEPAPYLPGKQIVANWRRNKIQAEQNRLSAEDEESKETAARLAAAIEDLKEQIEAAPRG